jgi:hypothetical protein
VRCRLKCVTALSVCQLLHIRSFSRQTTYLSEHSKSLSATCGRSVVFSGYYDFLHQWNWLPRYNWNIVERVVKFHNRNPKRLILECSDKYVVCLEKDRIWSSWQTDRAVTHFSLHLTVYPWWSVSLVEEIVVPRENYRPATSRWQTLSHNAASNTPHHERDSNSQLKWWYM